MNSLFTQQCHAVTIPEPPAQAPAKVRSWGAACCAMLGPLLSVFSNAVHAQTAPTDRALEGVYISSSRLTPLDSDITATQGEVDGANLRARPLLRPGDVLEAVPGLMVTQHSGDGKAHQYFLRGFNLDHGTDLRTTVMGMPINLVGHAHGQGYTDVQFLMPELIKSIRYKKGPYFAEEGDFSSAGAVNIDYARQLPTHIYSVTVGAHAYSRALLAGSSTQGPHSILYGLESSQQNGPWQVPENNRKLNGVLRYSGQRAGQGTDQMWSLTAMAYQSRWTATDHVPVEAVTSGLISRFGSLDPSSGGNTARHSLSGDFTHTTENSVTRMSAYAVKYRLNLLSDFTYFTQNAVGDTSGIPRDGFNQSDQRTMGGWAIEHSLNHRVLTAPAETAFGMQHRKDLLTPVALYDAYLGQRTATRSEDRFSQNQWGVYVKHTTQWTPGLRTTLGIRREHVHARVNGLYDDDANTATPLVQRSGAPSAALNLPKASVSFVPRRDTEVFLSAGRGFHSNDPRGVVTPTGPTPFLVSTLGQEVGVKHAGLLPGLRWAAALFKLKSESELVFVGDAGTTEPKSGSQRRGMELSANYDAGKQWSMDSDFTLTRARYVDEPAGPNIPNALRKTYSLGVVFREGQTLVSYRWRYLGPAPLNEDASLKSSSSLTSHLLLRHSIDPRVQIFGEILNLFNRENSDIEYAQNYALPTAPGVVRYGKTFHPAEPRTLRVGVVFTH